MQNQPPNKDKRPHVLTISSGKGGVGKSFLAANLGYALSESSNVLVWDADMYLPNQHLILGIEPPVRLNEAYYGNVDVESVKFPVKENLHLLADISSENKDHDFDPSLFQKVYDQIINDSSIDFIIIDSPAGASMEVIQCCSFADTVGIVINDEPTSLLDAYGLIKILMKFIEPENLRLLINNVIDLEDADEVSGKLNLATKNFLGTKLDILGFVPYDRSVRQSIIYQEILLRSEPDNEVSKSIFEISRRIADKEKVYAAG